MEVTREIVVDLLPLYESGEASPDTRAAVEAFLRQDPSLARLRDAPEAPPAAAAGADLERRAVERTRAVVRRRSWTLAFAVLFTLVPFTFAFQNETVTFFMFRDQPGSRLLLIAAAALWLQYARLTRSLHGAGL